MIDRTDLGPSAAQLAEERDRALLEAIERDEARQLRKLRGERARLSEDARQRKAVRKALERTGRAP